MEILLTVKNVSETIICFPEIRAFYEIIWKNMIESDRPHDKITRRMSFESCTTKAEETHSEYEIIIAFP
jgi:hypothetical protein